MSNKDIKTMEFELTEETQNFIASEKEAGKTIFLELTSDQKKVKVISEKYFKTTNYSMAAFLSLSGYQLVDIIFDVPYVPQKGVFLFEPSPQIEADSQKFFENGEKVKVQGFIRETNKLKHILEDKQNRRGVYKYGHKK